MPQFPDPLWVTFAQLALQNSTTQIQADSVDMFSLLFVCSGAVVGGFVAYTLLKRAFKNLF